MTTSAPARLEAPDLLSETRVARPGRRERLVVGAILLSSLLLRLPFLDRASLWLDEIWSIATARMPWRSIFSVVLHQDSNASLYYALLHEWLHLGTGVATTRFLSVLAGVATVFVLYLVGRRFAGGKAGLVAGLLLAVNAFHVQFSQEARAYSLVALLVTLSTLLFVESVERPTWRSWSTYVAVSSLAVYAHVFAVLVLAAHGSSLVLLKWRDVPWRRFLVSALAIGLLVLPVALLIRARMAEPNAPLAWVNPPSLRQVSDVYWHLTGHPLQIETVPVPLSKAYFALCLAALVLAVRKWRAAGRSFETWRLGLALCWLLVPIALAGAASIFKPMLVAKYFIVCLPSLCLLVAIGLTSIGWRWARVGAVVTAAGLALLQLPRYYEFRSRNQEWQAATGHILDGARPGDAAIFFVAPGRLLFDYYREAAGRLPPPIDVVYPEIRGRKEDPEDLFYMPPMRSDLLDRLASRNRRVWLVLFHDSFSFTSGTARHLEEALASRYRKAEASRFEGYAEAVTLTLYADGQADP